MNDANDWMYIFSNLSKYDNGNIIRYTVEEVGTPNEYTKQVIPINHTFEIINTYTPEVVNITVNKVWNDSHNQDGVRPENVTIDLFADGELVDTIVVDITTNWTYTFTNLPKYDNGVPIEYAVYETGIPDHYMVSYDGYNIINTYVPKTTELIIVKEWNDNHNQDGVRPGSIKVQLYADGVEVGEPVILNDDNHWEHIFNNLPMYENGILIEYSVREDKVNYYTSTVTNVNNTLIIVNTHVPSLTDIIVYKYWDDDDNRDGIRPESVTVDLLADGELVDRFVLSEDNNWTYAFTNLPKYYMGKLIKYSIFEVSLNEEYFVEYEGFNIINKHTPKVTEINVVKVWDDNNNKAGLRSEYVIVELYANGNPTGYNITLNYDNHWEHVFENLPVYEDGQPITYTVKELDISSKYTQSINRTDETFIITNTFIPDVKSMKFAWGWYLIGLNESDSYNISGNDSGNSHEKVIIVKKPKISNKNHYIGYGYRYGRYNRYNRYSWFNKYNRYNRYNRYSGYRGHGQSSYKLYRLYIYLLGEYMDGNLTYDQFIALLDENHIEYFDEDGMIVIDYENLEDVPQEITVQDTMEVIPSSSDNVDVSNPEHYDAPVIDRGQVEVKSEASAEADAVAEVDSTE